MVMVVYFPFFWNKISFIFIGAVVESKAQLVGLHERVRSDVGGGIPKAATGQGNASVGTVQGGKSVATASYPGAEDAAELLRYGLSFQRRVLFYQNFKFESWMNILIVVN